jgi:hypothetical protein
MTPAERLSNPEAVLSRTDLAQLGYERRAVDAIFRALPTLHLPGYSRPMVKVGAYLELVESCTSHETTTPQETSRALIRRPETLSRGSMGQGGTEHPCKTAISSGSGRHGGRHP